MGLDMYLSIRKHDLVSSYSHTDKLFKQKVMDIVPKNLIDTFTFFDKDKSRSITPSVTINVDIEVAYWRKANAIHRWFIQNCTRDHKDECQEIYVDVSQLKDLVNTCKKVLADHRLADQLLPTQEGFFFGTYEYDDWYFDDLQSTIDQLEPVIDFMDKANAEYDAWANKMKEMPFEDRQDHLKDAPPLYECIYQASW